jgi:hypothetical protein
MKAHHPRAVVVVALDAVAAVRAVANLPATILNHRAHGAEVPACSGRSCRSCQGGRKKMMRIGCSRGWGEGNLSRRGAVHQLGCFFISSSCSLTPVIVSVFGFVFLLVRKGFAHIFYVIPLSIAVANSTEAVTLACSHART